MSNIATISLSDLIFEFGNRFFKIDDDAWMNIQDDLNYETTDSRGLNGYVLRVEEKTSGYGINLMKFLQTAFEIFSSILFHKNQKSQTKSNRSEVVHHYVNTQAAIQHRVQSRLLKVINEDLDKWEKTESAKAYTTKKIKKQFVKNQFKSMRQKPNI